MKLEDFASPLVASNRFIKASFGGFAGGGKSRTASEFVLGSYKDMGYTKPILIIDNEKGSRFLIPFFASAGVKAYVKDTVHLSDVLSAIDMLRAGEIEYLFIDTLTKVWYQYVRDYKQKNRRTFMELSDWGKILPAWQEEFSDRFVGAQGSIVFTGRGGYSYEKEEDQVDDSGRVKKGQFVKSGVKMKLAGETPFEPDLNIWMEQQQEVTAEGPKTWREAHIMKDRSGLIDGKVFAQPTYEMFRPVVQYLNQVEVGSVAGATSISNIAPSENFEGHRRREQREIALEEILGILSKHYPSQSADDKRARQGLLERHFGTLSWKKVETFPLEKLTVAFDAIKAELEPAPAKSTDERRQCLIEMLQLEAASGTVELGMCWAALSDDEKSLVTEQWYGHLLSETMKRAA